MADVGLAETGDLAFPRKVAMLMWLMVRDFGLYQIVGVSSF
ncbi:hypothetical protein CEB3_c09330 [Peptococcaceae bacterium CEB3]|nr:hypothetical protein CEB3_c09330 [Peptococcaceae bacterium CEB3]